jgi:small conductance mechanosensitive channel
MPAIFNSYLTARSNLCRHVLYTLHGNRIEIMSPAFMNQRRLPEDLKIIPAQAEKEPIKDVSVAEQVVFDKAEKAEQIEKEKQQLLDKIQECKRNIEEASEEDKKQIQEMIKECREQLKTIEKPAVE